MMMMIQLLPFKIIILCYFKIAFGKVLVLPIDGRFIVDEFKSMPSTFGIPLPHEGLRGLLVCAEPPDACMSLEGPPPNVTTTEEKRIVLISRSPRNCSFEHKVRMAQNASYDGVIVYNVGSDEVEQMSAENSTGIRIPSVFVGETTGMSFKELFCNEDYLIIINTDEF